MSADAVKLQTWTTSQEEEDRMFTGHFHHWKTMIANVQERDLRDKCVLDFGCNQGGFIQMLYNTLPFKKAAGVDIAEDSLAKAAKRNAHLPIDFYPAAELEKSVPDLILPSVMRLFICCLIYTPMRKPCGMF